MLTYVSSFLAGEVDPFWPHVWLLSLSVGASIAVGAGIIFERPKYSTAIHNAAFWLVVTGIAIEALCTIFLFVFDEGISNAQTRKISSLETTNIALQRIVAPRRIPLEELPLPVMNWITTTCQQLSALASPSILVQTLPEREPKRLTQDIVEMFMSYKWQSTQIDEKQSSLFPLYMPDGITIAAYPLRSGCPIGSVRRA
jgi:hypothetical protein